MLEASFMGKRTASCNCSPFSRPKLKLAQNRRLAQRRRQLLLQQLEPRQLLAADPLPQPYQMPSSYQASAGIAPTAAPPTPYSYDLTSSTALTLVLPPPNSTSPASLATPVNVSTPLTAYPPPDSYLPPTTYAPPPSYSPPDSYLLPGAEVLLAPPASGAIDYQSQQLGTPSGAATSSLVTTPAVALTQPPGVSPIITPHGVSGGSNTNAYSYSPPSDPSGDILLAPEPSPLAAPPITVSANAVDAPPTNEAAVVPVALEEGGFFGIATDFGLPELAWWPTSPTSYRPELIVLPGHPDNLPVEELPPPIVNVRATPPEARTAYESAVAAAEATYKQAVANAEAAHTAALAAAGANHSNAISAAARAKQAAIDGFTPQTLTALQQAVEAAEHALWAEIERVKQEALAQLTASQDAAHSVRNTRDQIAETQYHSASNAARDASANRMSASEHRYIEAQDRLYNNEITQAQFDALLAGWVAERRAEEQRLAEELSGYRQIYDNALIDNEATERIANASAQQRAEVQIAEAGRAQQATLAQTKHSLAIAQNSNLYGQKLTAAAANVQYQREVAAATETYAHAKTDADTAKAVAIRTAAATRSKALAVASATLSTAIAHDSATVIIDTFSANTSAAAAYRVATARAERELQIQQADALRNQQLAIIDADLALEVTLLLASGERGKQDASANQLREQSFADAATRFRTAYFELLQQQADEASSAQINAGQERDAARREFDVDMAAVQQIRATRNANELKPGRQASALVQNKRDHNLISQATYLAEKEALARQAKESQLAILRDTFGSPGSSGSSNAPGGTESEARESWLAKNNRATQELNQQQRTRAAEANRATADLSKQHDQDVATAQQNYKAAIVDATLTANSTAQSAIQIWVQSASQTHAEYQTALAGAAAAHAKTFAQATVDFHAAVASHRADAITTFANGEENPWASRAAAAAAADAARIASLATAYTTLVDVTATAAAKAVGEAATAHATMIAETTTAQITANAAIQAAIATYTTTLAGAEQTRDTNHSMAVSVHDSAIATEHQAWRDTKDNAEFNRSAGYFGALLFSLSELISVNPMASAVEASRRALEVNAGTSYASTVVGVHQDYLISLARESKILHDAVVGLKANFETTAADAFEDLQRSQAAANRIATSQIATSQSTFATSLAHIGAEHNTTVLTADYNFTIGAADATRIYAKALAAADIALDTALAQRERDAVEAWAETQRDTSGNVKPQAQYSVAVYDAALSWQRAAAPHIQSYYDAIADQSHQLIIDSANANRRAEQGLIIADESFTIVVADAEATLGGDIGLAQQQRIATSASIDASLARTSSNLAKTFADTFSSGRQRLQAGYASESATSELRLVDHRSQLHTKQISSQDYQARREQNQTALMLALTGLERDFAIERADAAEQWGHQYADEHHQNFIRQVDAAAAALQSIADAHKAGGREMATAVESYQTEMAQLDAARAIALVRAEAAFDHNTALHWARLVENLGQINVNYAHAVAAAEAAHHLTVAEHAAQKLIAQSGPRPDQNRQFAIRVANARADFFRNVSEDYIHAVTSTARQTAEVARRTADAEAERQSAQGTAAITFVTTTQNAWADATAELARATRDFAVAKWNDLSSWVQASVAADEAWQTTMAETYRIAGRDFATAEAVAYRSAAEQAYVALQQMATTSVPMPTGPAGATSGGNHLDAYNRAIATLHFNINSAIATSGGIRSGKLATAEQEQVSRLAAAADAKALAGSAAQHRLDIKVNDALRDLRNSNDDADQAFSRSIAQIDRDHVVAHAETVRAALLAQYRAARDLYASFSHLTDLNVRYTIAQVRGAYAYAQALLPHYVTTQTTIADANLDYAHTVIDAHRDHRQRLTDAAHRYGSGVADAQQSDRDQQSGLWVTAVNAHAAAIATAKATIATAAATRDQARATLERDAAIAAGWGKSRPINAQAMATAQQTYETARADALRESNDVVNTARDTYFRGLAAINRDAESNAADHEHAFSRAVIDSLAELRNAEINAGFTATQIEIDAQHDYRIADVDAVIAGLTAVRNDFNTAATAQARLLAVTNRDQRVDAIDTERATALRRAATTQTTQLSKVADEKSKALGEASAVRDQQRTSAQSLYAEATSPQTLAYRKLPHIVNSKAITLGTNVQPAPFMEAGQLTLVDSLTQQFTYGGSGAQVITGIADELYVYTGAASAVDMVKYLIRAEINFYADGIRRLPQGDETVQYAGMAWSLARQQAALNAQGVINWGQWASSSIANWGVSGGHYQYGLGVLGSSLAEGAAGFVAGLVVDPTGTAAGVAGVADAYYRAGGTVAVVGAFTGTLSLYESVAGIDLLTGDALSGAERIDRSMLGTSVILTGIGTSGLSNIARRSGQAVIDMVTSFKWGVSGPSPQPTNLTAPTVSRPIWTTLRARQGGLLKGDNLAHPGATSEIMVLGRQADTAEFIGRTGYNVLNTNIWDIHVNDGWVLRGIMEGRTFLLASRPSIATLRQAAKKFPDGHIERDVTVFFRELKLLRQADYIQATLQNGQIVMTPRIKK